MSTAALKKSETSAKDITLASVSARYAKVDGALKAALAEHDAQRQEKQQIIQAAIALREQKAENRTATLETATTRTGLIKKFVRPDPMKGNRHAEPPSELTAAQIKLNAQIRDVLGADFAGLLPETTTEKKPSERDRLREIGDRMDVLEGAIGLLRAELEDARLDASKMACAALQSEYSAIADDLVAKVHAMHEATMRYLQLADTLNGKQIAWARLGPLDVHALPVAISILLKSARQVGRIDKLPAGVRS